MAHGTSPKPSPPPPPVGRQLRAKASALEVEELGREVRAKATATALEDLSRVVRGKVGAGALRDALSDTATKTAVVSALHRKANKETVVRGHLSCVRVCMCVCVCARVRVENRVGVLGLEHVGCRCCLHYCVSLPGGHDGLR